VVEVSSTTPPVPVFGAGAAEVVGASEVVVVDVVGEALNSPPLSPAQADTESTTRAAKALRRIQNCIGLPITFVNTVRNPNPEEMIPAHRSDIVHNSVSLVGAVFASPDKGEMHAFGNESVLSGHRGQNGSKFLERYVHRGSTLLTDQVLVIGRFREMVDPGAVTQMNVVEVAEFLQDVEGSIDGRLVDSHPGAIPSPSQDVCSAHVFFV
jgi:hypothetical protein